MVIVSLFFELSISDTQVALQGLENEHATSKGCLRVINKSKDDIILSVRQFLPLFLLYANDPLLFIFKSMDSMFFEVTQRRRLTPTSNTTTMAVYPNEGSGQLHLHHSDDVVGTRYPWYITNPRQGTLAA
jgi:hypothetical protein